MNYQPKGGMCARCKYKMKDCSDLKFNKMLVIEVGKDISIVKCSEFLRVIK